MHYIILHASLGHMMTAHEKTLFFVSHGFAEFTNHAFASEADTGNICGTYSSKETTIQNNDVL